MSPTDKIKSRVDKYNLTYVWLINELSRTKDIETDKTEMSSVINGTRKGAKADAIIKCSNEVLDDYEQSYYSQ